MGFFGGRWQQGERLPVACLFLWLFYITRGLSCVHVITLPGFSNLSVHIPATWPPLGLKGEQTTAYSLPSGVWILGRGPCRFWKQAWAICLRNSRVSKSRVAPGGHSLLNMMLGRALKNEAGELSLCPGQRVLLPRVLMREIYRWSQPKNHKASKEHRHQ